MGWRLQRQRLVQYRQRILVLSQAVINLADRGEQGCLGRRLILQTGPQTLRARVQQFTGGDQIAAVLLRIRQLEQIHQEVRHLFRAGTLMIGKFTLFRYAIALCCNTLGLDVGRGREGQIASAPGPCGHRQPMTPTISRGG
jgi:hypothetical protein